MRGLMKMKSWRICEGGEMRSEWMTKLYQCCWRLWEKQDVAWRLDLAGRLGIGLGWI